MREDCNSSCSPTLSNLRVSHSAYIVYACECMRVYARVWICIFILIVMFYNLWQSYVCIKEKICNSITTTTTTTILFCMCYLPHTHRDNVWLLNFPIAGYISQQLCAEWKMLNHLCTVSSCYWIWEKVIIWKGFRFLKNI